MNLSTLSNAKDKVILGVVNRKRRFVQWLRCRNRIDGIFSIAILLLCIFFLETYLTVPLPSSLNGMGGMVVGILLLISIYPYAADRWREYRRHSDSTASLDKTTGAKPTTPPEQANATVDVKPDTEHAPAKHESPAEQYQFYKQGEVWTMAFRNGKGFQLKDMKGFSYIVSLLRQPNYGFHILELVRSVEPAIFNDLQHQVQSRSVQDLEIEEGLNINEGEAGMEVYDAETRQNLNKQLKEIEEILERTTVPAEKAKLESEAAQLQEYLNEGKGKRGKIRTKGEMAERARTRVAHLVDGAIDKIGKYDSAFADHLRGAIKIKLADNRYLPPQPVAWQT